MGGNPCRFKIILNGETIQNELHSICYQIQKEGVQIGDKSLYEIVYMLNEMEDLVFRIKRTLLESQGFTGTKEQGGWPYSLTQK